MKVLAKLQELLEMNRIPFIAIGGLASIAWGARRPLVDIDIQVKYSDLLAVKELFAEYLRVDIRHYVTEKWDIKQMVLAIDGIGVDICAAEDFYVVKDGKRYLVDNSLDAPILKDIEGIRVPVLPKDRLMAYKRLIGRIVDLEDLAQLK